MCRVAGKERQPEYQQGGRRKQRGRNVKFNEEERKRRRRIHREAGIKVLLFLKSLLI